MSARKVDDIFTRDNLDGGNVEMNLQYFPSVGHLRIGLFSIHGLQMILSKMEVEVSVYDSKGKIMKKRIIREATRATSELDVVRFKEDVHFHTKGEKFNNCIIRVRICKPSRKMRSRQILAIGWPALKDHDLVLDTTLTLALSTPKVNQILYLHIFLTQVS